MTGTGPIPLTVIGGYLGAGKTTLLNRLLHATTARRLAVVVNDFGSINIDAALIAQHDGETMSLTNGCICCTLANGFYDALTSLRDREDPPDHIVVEASGVSDPFKIGQYGHLDGLSLDGVIVLADAETVRARSRDRYVGRTVIRQLQGADILVLTKTDLASASERETVNAWLRSVSPTATLIEANSGEIDPALILGIAAHAGSSPADGTPKELAEEHDHTFETWVFAQDTPMTGDAIDTFAAALPDGIVRAKGLVDFAESPGHAAIFQLVGRRWQLTEGPAWGARTPRTEIVLIGPRDALDWPSLRQRLGDEFHQAGTPPEDPPA